MKKFALNYNQISPFGGLKGARNMSAGSVDETAIEFRKIFNRAAPDFFRTEKRIP